MGETISVRLGEISGLEALREVNVRARDLKPLFAAIKASGFFHDPNNYSRPDRLLGEVATEQGGFEINWSPGYPKSKRRIGAGKKRLAVRSKRPYHPELVPEAAERVTNWIARYLVTGIVEVH